MQAYQPHFTNTNLFQHILYMLVQQVTPLQVAQGYQRVLLSCHGNTH